MHSDLLMFVALTAAGALAVGHGASSAPTLTADQRLAPNTLRGVWEVSEQSIRSAGGAWSTATVPYSSLYIFTAKHYSYMFAPGSGPRRLFTGDPNKPTEAEKVAAYDSFVAASGTYELSGSGLTLKATLHKNPNEMKGESLAYDVEFAGNQLVLTIVKPPFAPDQERRTVLTRLE